MSQATFTTPSSPLTMTALKTFLDNALAALVTVQRGDPAGISSPTEGMLCWDTTGATDILKRYTVAAGWVSLYSCNITTGAVVPYKDGAQMTVMPTGAMTPYAGTTAPTGWLLCYGQAVSRSTYATLFGVISTTYGVGDGSTTFNVPDMRGRSFIGLDNLGGSAASRVAAATSLGYAAGAEEVDLSHTHTGPSHTHTGPSHSHAIARNGWPAPSVLSVTGYIQMSSNASSLYVASGDLSTGAAGTGATGAAGTGATGSGGSATQSVMSPYMAGGWIIKY